MKHKKLYIVLVVILSLILILIIATRCARKAGPETAEQKGELHGISRTLTEESGESGTVWTWSYEPYSAGQSNITTILSDNANASVSGALSAGYTAIFNPSPGETALQSLRARTTGTALTYGRLTEESAPKRYRITIGILPSPYVSVNVSFNLIGATTGRSVYESSTETVAQSTNTVNAQEIEWLIEETEFPTTYSNQVYIEFFVWATYQGSGSNSFGVSAFSYAAESPTEYDLGYEAGYEAAYEKYKDDYRIGYGTGYDAGYSAGYRGGVTDGYDEGVEEYYQARYEEGYAAGRQAGLAETIEDATGLNAVKSMLTSVYSVFEIKIFGWFSLGDVVGIMVIIGIFFFILKIIRG